MRLKYNYLISITAIVVYILPFLLIVQYAYLGADDFCRVNGYQNYLSQIQNWITSHNGRYTNSFISFLPIYNNIYVYRIVLGALFISLGISLYFFLKSLFAHLKAFKDQSTIFLITCLSFIVLISQLPSIHEFFYWYAATSAYLISIIILLCFYNLLLSNFINKSFQRSSQIFLLIILGVGNNELNIPIICGSLFFLMIFFLIKERRIPIQLLLMNMISWACSLFVIFSPGSLNRQTHFSGGDLFFSLKNAFLSAGAFSIKTILELPYLLIYTIFFLYLLGMKSKGKIKINPFILISISFLLFVGVLFVKYYATGNLQLNQGRVGNMIHIIFLIFLILNLLNLSNWVEGKILIKISSRKKMFVFGIVLFLVLIPLINHNYNSLIEDIYRENFRRFHSDMEEQRRILAKSKGGNLILEQIEGTNTIKYYGPTTNVENWANTCFTRYINYQMKKKFETLLVE